QILQPSVTGRRLAIRPAEGREYHVHAGRREPRIRAVGRRRASRPDGLTRPSREHPPARDHAYRDRRDKRWRVWTHGHATFHYAVERHVCRARVARETR